MKVLQPKKIGHGKKGTPKYLFRYRKDGKEIKRQVTCEPKDVNEYFQEWCAEIQYIPNRKRIKIKDVVNNYIEKTLKEDTKLARL